ncbi:S-adenosyl-L-methionine-dependent methyltransferase, partial [Basidiobolus meristosporus CBS 931.73]
MSRIQRKLSFRKKWGKAKELNFTERQEKTAVTFSRREVYVAGSAGRFLNIANTQTTASLKRRFVREASLRKAVVVEIPIKRRRTSTGAVRVLVPTFERSNRAITREGEEEIVQLLTNYSVAIAEEESQKKYHEFYLDSFTFYNAKGQPIELTEDIDFEEPIIWIKSTVQDDTWYLLKSPSQSYAKAWYKFCWKARFTKYIIDFVQEDPERLFKDIKVKKEFQRVATKLKWREYTLTTPKVEFWFRNLFGRHIRKINLPCSPEESSNAPPENLDPVTGFGIDFVPSDIEWRDPLLLEEGLYNEIVYGGMPIKVGDIVELHHVPHVYFCRFFYDHLNGCFWKLDQEELSNSKKVLVCGCAATSDSVLHKSELYNVREYRVGDTLLLRPTRYRDQPLYKVCEVTRVDTRSQQLTIRYFINARETCQKYKLEVPKPALNELYFCEKYDILNLKDFGKIGRFCHVEYKSPRSHLPVNLQHHGAGLQYFFSYRFEEQGERLLEIDCNIPERFPPYLTKSSGYKKLRVLDLFCGGGSFGRGLQDTGLFECKWAVDIDCMATFTYKSNAYGENVQVYNQSVNLFLENCIKNNSCTPKKGEVDMILAGNPCQGFSSLNLNRSNDQSQSNNSLLASLASFVEFYEPKYVLLENVSNFPKVTVEVDGKKRSPFRIFLAFLLAMGYQVRWSYISAAHHGCPQNRVRFFLWAAAKGEELPLFPPPSHHGTNARYAQTSITLPSTEKVPGVVEPMFASFPMRTIDEAIGDLPPIGEGHIQHFEFPDHMVVPLPYEQQMLVNQIPIYPPGCDYRYLVGQRLPNGNTVVLPSWLKRKIARGTSLGTQFGRVDRDGLFQTITTRCVPTGFQGRVLHYQENRVLSVREVARAQGFLDSDQIVGRPQDQYRIIGNSVPRSLAFAL